MDRIAESLKSKIMSAEEAAKMIKSGMTIGVSGFTNIGYPKAVPTGFGRIETREGFNDYGRSGDGRRAGWRTRSCRTGEVSLRASVE